MLQTTDTAVLLLVSWQKCSNFNKVNKADWNVASY